MRVRALTSSHLSLLSGLAGYLLFSACDVKIFSHYINESESACKFAFIASEWAGGLFIIISRMYYKIFLRYYKK